MKKIKKSMLIIGAMMVLFVTAYAQASCALVVRVQSGDIRVTTWNCNDGVHTDISFYSGGSWHQL
jgi:hypothetical protein